MIIDDTRLIPPDIDVDDTLTPMECYMSCTHGEACAAQMERLRGKLADGETYSEEHLVRDLGCGEDCDSYEENEEPSLRMACRRLVEVVKAIEAETGKTIISSRFADLLLDLGFKVR